MSSLEQEIADLKAEIADYRGMLASATSEEMTGVLLQTITASRQNLERLYTQLERQQQSAGKYL
jgi:ribosomal protein L29